MKRNTWGKMMVCWAMVAAFGLAVTGCASVKDLKRVEAMAQQALTNSEAAAKTSADDVLKVQAAADQAEKAAARAESAAGAAEHSAEKAQAMADKAEAIFMKKMKK